MSQKETATEEKGGRSYWGFVVWPMVVGVLAIFCQGCGTTVRLGGDSGRSGVFNVSYEEAKTRLNQMRKATQWRRKLSIRPSEPVAGQRYVLRIHEGGSPPAMSLTDI